ncbi:MAG: hypothetical protein J0L97_10990 [Alphaproteobacteria bacterium]|nr:hypothetical protein [Alphaproteobacteria bacterium]
MDITALAAHCLESQKPFMEYLLTMLDEQFKAYDAEFHGAEGRAFLQKRLGEQRRDAAKVKTQFQTMARALLVLGGRAANPSMEYVEKHRAMLRILQVAGSMTPEQLGEMECIIGSTQEEAAMAELKALGSYERILRDLSRHCHDQFPKQENGEPTPEFQAWYDGLQAALRQVILSVENSLAVFAEYQLNLWAKRKHQAA